ncbi:MAG TPA: protein kinase [Blastocatellia bacterium]|nr:protein kinase [Blastocatellia bacterium]
MASEVESLLAANDQAGSFIEALPTGEATVALEGEAVEPQLALVGRKISHYEVLSPLGSGGMGEVYLAHDTKLSRKVAIKFLPKQLTANEQARRRFLREARAAATLDHPNICAIHEVGEEDDLSFIVMQYIEGETLADRIRRQPLELSEALTIAVQVADALSEAHSRRVIHRDIKPQNVMMTARGQVKVLDFGLAKVMPDGLSVQSEAETESLLSESGVILGTIPYMSPEQVRGEALDARTDIFSFGALLYEMVSGRQPFVSNSNATTITAILTKEAPPLARYSAEVPAELERIVAKALRKDRDERYQGIKDLGLDLKNLKEELEFEARLERSRPPDVKGEGGGISTASNQPTLVTSPELPASTGEVGGSKTGSGAKLFTGAITRHKRAAAIVLAVLVVGIAAIASLTPLIYRGFRTEQPPSQRALSRFTFDPGLQSEPTWSPDGRLIAYSSDRSGNFDIWVQPVGEGDPVQVTKSTAHDWQPHWSPDGNRIVFRSEREGGGLFVAPALGGNERKISSFGYRPRWSPDGSQILFSTSLLWVWETHKVYVVGLDGRAPREVLPEFLAEFITPPQVAWRPDGQGVSLWGTHRQLGASFWTVPVAGGTPVRSALTKRVEQQLKEASVTLNDFLWAPSGRIIYFEGTAQGVRNLWRVEVDPQTLDWIAGPERLTSGAGLDTDLALSPDGKRLAFTTRTERTRIWSLPFNAQTGRTRGGSQPITSAGLDAWNPKLSRDGKKLVFSAQRAGKQEVWQKSLEDGRETLLIAGDNFGRYHPSLSRDGTRLAYRRYRSASPDIADLRPQAEASIVLLPAGGGEEQLITSPTTLTEVASDWSADGAWILVSSDHQTPGRTAICLFPVSAAPRAETQMRVVTSHPEYNLWQGHYSPDERWITFNAIRPTESGVSTIYVIPAAGGEWRRITEGKYWDDIPRWSPDGRTIYFVSGRSGFFNVWGMRFDPTGGNPVGEAFRVTAFESPGQMMSPRLVQLIGISLAADRLVLPITEVSGSIWILENVDLF